LIATSAESAACKVLILRALPRGADSRALRWATIYSPRPIRWGCWGIHSSENLDEVILRWRPGTGYTNFVIGYVTFIVMSFFYAHKHLRRGDILLCIDLETAILGMLAAKMRGAKIHYDMADPFFLAKPVPCKPFWRKLEAWYISKADVVTAPHQSRFKLFFSESPSRARVVENVPDICVEDDDFNYRPSRKEGRSLTLGYFGTLDYHRGIEDILTFVDAHLDIHLKIGGRGVLQNLIIEAARQCERIQFVGSYRPDDLGTLTQGVDVYCSLYYGSKPLHRFAAPNKYYEHLALGIPILISACTPYASDVFQNGTGWVIEDGRSALERWYVQVCDDLDSFERYSKKARELWNTHYADWLTHQQNLFDNIG